jgi:uncharacterized membrane protein YdjX (TVP38/TMEM64 family)
MIWSILILMLGTALIVAFFILDKHNRLSRMIQSSGDWAIVASIVLMFLLCIIPVPSEFLIVLNMKVFGVWWGTLYSWIGSLAGSVAVFLLARYFMQGLLQRFISEARMKQVTSWIGDRGVIGLILVRIVPLPFIVVNYTAGVVRSISLWNFIWTSVVGGIPYYLGAALLFLGVSKKYVIWLVIGGIVVVAVWIAGYINNQRKNKLTQGGADHAS